MMEKDDVAGLVEAIKTAANAGRIDWIKLWSQDDFYRTAAALTAQAAALAEKDAEIDDLRWARQCVGVAHEYLRDALSLPEDAPRRFDYYAHLIEQKDAELSALREQVVAARKILSNPFAYSDLQSCVDAAFDTLAALPASLAGMVLVEKEVLERALSILENLEPMGLDSTKHERAVEAILRGLLAAQDPRP